jgi:hypothetical protein
MGPAKTSGAHRFTAAVAAMTLGCMTSSHIRLTRRLAAGLVALGAALSLATAAQAQSPASLLTLLPRDGSHPYLDGHGKGVQIYRCDAAAGGFAWTFVAPRADLTGNRGRVIIKHFGGPTWQAGDGSKVVGSVVSNVPVSPTAIPWLLLSATTTPAPGGGGLLAGTTFVQRLLTVGGVAPAASTCGAANLGATAEVPYTAEYVFWRK